MSVFELRFDDFSLECIPRRIAESNLAPLRGEGCSWPSALIARFRHLLIIRLSWSSLAPSIHLKWNCAATCAIYA